ncbi:MAG TPA: carbohydrate-binding family 9-like protein [Bacteroidales bacterium]|jgi:hypothetical protein|nr:carbohydrate-binding family 9-like protein [Bacteroidales bacterium]
MKTAEAKKTGLKENFPSMGKISELLDTGKRHKISTLNWKDKGFTYMPDVDFSIAYSDNEIFIKYFVTEEYFKAEKTESNQNVYEDSCVEFFVSPENDGIYYNFEFNALGTCLMGSGHSRADTTRVDPAIISRIRRLPQPGIRPTTETKGKFSWTLTVAIPFDAFFHHKVTGLKGKTLRANFYKCGDMLTVPHFVTWNAVVTENPDYHRPEFFGEVKFI